MHHRLSILLLAGCLFASASRAQEARLVADLQPGTGSGLLLFIPCTGPPITSFPSSLAVAGDRLLFPADDGLTGPELWRFDPATDTVEQVADLRPGPPGGLAIGCAPNPLLAHRGEVFFAAEADDGTEPWRSDGTEAGTLQIDDLLPGPESSAPASFTAFGSRVLFNASAGPATGGEPWVIEGGTATPLGDLNPGFATSTATFLAATASRAYFRAGRPTDGNELWRTDGTEAGTELVQDLAPGPDSITTTSVLPFGDGILIATRSPMHALYRVTDEGGYALLRSFDLAPSNISRVFGLTPVPGGAAFWVRDDDGPFRLWRTDGTPGGTRIVDGVAFESGSLSPFSTWAAGGVMVFPIRDDTGLTLWRTDGTTDTTRSLAVVGAPGSSIALSHDASGTLLVAIDGPGDAPRLWRTRGTTATTRAIGDLCPTATDCRPASTAVLDGTLFYTAEDDAHGRELWAIDLGLGGTPAIPTLGGTAMALLALLLAAFAVHIMRR